MMYVDDNQQQAVLFAYKVDNWYGQPLPRIRLQGLDAQATYLLTERNVKAGQQPCSLSGKLFNGQFLMEVGLEIPLDWDYASRVLELNKQ